MRGRHIPAGTTVAVFYMALSCNLLEHNLCLKPNNRQLLEKRTKLTQETQVVQSVSILTTYPPIRTVHPSAVSHHQLSTFELR